MEVGSFAVMPQGQRGRRRKRQDDSNSGHHHPQVHQGTKSERRNGNFDDLNRVKRRADRSRSPSPPPINLNALKLQKEVLPELLKEVEMMLARKNKPPDKMNQKPVLKASKRKKKNKKKAKVYALKESPDVYWQTKDRLGKERSLQAMDQHTRGFFPHQHMGQDINYGGEYYGKEYRAPLLSTTKEEMFSFIRMRHITKVLQHHGKPKLEAILKIQKFVRHIRLKRRFQARVRRREQLMTVIYRLQFKFRYKAAKENLRRAILHHRRALFRRWRNQCDREIRRKFGEFCMGELQNFRHNNGNAPIQTRENVLDEMLLLAPAEQLARTYRRSEQRRKRERKWIRKEIVAKRNIVDQVVTRGLIQMLHIHVLMSKVFIAWRTRAMAQAKAANGFRLASRDRFHFMIIMNAVVWSQLREHSFEVWQHQAKVSAQRRRFNVSMFLLCVDLASYNSERQRLMIREKALPFWRHSTKRNRFEIWKRYVQFQREQYEFATNYHLLHDSPKQGSVLGRSRFIYKVPYLRHSFGALPLYFSRWWVYSSNRIVERAAMAKGEVSGERKLLRQGLEAVARERRRKRFFRFGMLMATEKHDQLLIQRSMWNWKRFVENSHEQMERAIVHYNTYLRYKTFREWSAHTFFFGPAMDQVAQVLESTVEITVDSVNLWNAAQHHEVWQKRLGLNAMRWHMERRKVERMHIVKIRRMYKKICFRVWKDWSIPYQVRLEAAKRLQNFWRTCIAQRTFLERHRWMVMKRALCNEKVRQAAEGLDLYACRMQRTIRALLARKAQERAEEIALENLKTKQRKERQRATAVFKERYTVIQRKDNKELNLKKDKCIRQIQAWLRGAYCRKFGEAYKMKTERVGAAVVIQRAWKRRYVFLCDVATVIQAWYRGTKSRLEVRRVRKYRRIATNRVEMQSRTFRMLRPILKRHRRISNVIAAMEMVGLMPDEDKAQKVVKRIKLLEDLKLQRERIIHEDRRRLVEEEKSTKLPPNLFKYKAQMVEWKNIAASKAVDFAHKTYAMDSKMRQAHPLELSDLKPIQITSQDERSYLETLAEKEKRKLMLEKVTRDLIERDAATKIQALFRGKACRVRHERKQIKGFLREYLDGEMLERLQSLGIKGRRDQVRAIKFMRKTRETVARAPTFVARPTMNALRKTSMAGKSFLLRRSTKNLPVNLEQTLTSRPILRNERTTILDDQIQKHRNTMLRLKFGKRRNAWTSEPHKEKRRNAFVPMAPIPSMFTSTYYTDGGYSFAGFWVDGAPFGFGRAFDFTIPRLVPGFPKNKIGSISVASGNWKRGGTFSGLFRLTFTCGSSFQGLVTKEGTPFFRGKYVFPLTSQALFGFFDLSDWDPMSFLPTSPSPSASSLRRCGTGAGSQKSTHRLLGPRKRKSTTRRRTRTKRPGSGETAVSDGEDFDANSWFEYGEGRRKWALNTNFDLDTSSSEEEDEDGEEKEPTEEELRRRIMEEAQNDNDKLTQLYPLPESYYDGELDSEGRFHGRGELVLCNGTKYRGSFVNHEVCGFGKVTYADKSTYEGEFARGCRHGRGRMIWPAGADEDTTLASFYDGGWKYDIKHGHGQEWDEEMNQGFEGYFHEGSRHGQGFEIYEINPDTLEKLSWRPGVWDDGELVRYLCDTITKGQTDAFVERLTPKTYKEEELVYGSAFALDILRRYERRIHLHMSLRFPTGVNGEDLRAQACVEKLQDYWKAKNTLEKLDGVLERDLKEDMKGLKRVLRKHHEKLAQKLELVHETMIKLVPVNAELTHLEARLKHHESKLDKESFDLAERISDCELGILGELMQEAENTLSRLTPRHVVGLIDGYVSQPPMYIRRGLGALFIILRLMRLDINNADDASVNRAMEWTDINGFVTNEEWRDATKIFFSEDGELIPDFLNRRMAKIVSEWKMSFEGGDSSRLSYAFRGSLEHLMCLTKLILDPMHEPMRVLRESGDVFRGEAMHAIWSWIHAWYAACRVNDSLEHSFRRNQHHKRSVQACKSRMEAVREQHREIKSALDTYRSSCWMISSEIQTYRHELDELKSKIDIGVANLEMIQDVHLNRAEMSHGGQVDHLVLEWSEEDLKNSEMSIKETKETLDAVEAKLDLLHKKLAQNDKILSTLEPALEKLERSRKPVLDEAESAIRRLGADHLLALYNIGGAAPNFLFIIGRILCAIMGKRDVSWRGAMDMFVKSGIDSKTGKKITKGNPTFLKKLLGVDKSVVYKRCAFFIRGAIEESGLNLAYVEEKMARQRFSKEAVLATKIFCQYVLAIDTFCHVEGSVEPLGARSHKLKRENESYEKEKELLIARRNELQEKLLHKNKVRNTIAIGLQAST